MIKNNRRQIVAWLAAWLWLPLFAQNGFEVTVQLPSGNKTIHTGGISFLRHGGSERYAWKPADSSALSYGSLGRAYDIAYVGRIRRHVEHTSQLTLPKNTPVRQDDVVLIGMEDGLKPDAGGQYKTSSDQLMAMTKDGKLIYKCWASADSVVRNRQADLNAMETAIAYLLPVFPFVAEQTSDRVFGWQKEMLRRLDVTRKLAEAIDASIVRHGYLERGDIEAPLAEAYQKVLGLMGLASPRTDGRHAPRRIPMNPFMVEKDGHAGLRFDITSSQWDGVDRQWHCTLTAMNYNRLGYTGIARGYKDASGMAWLYHADNWVEHVRYVVPPQRVSSFMSHFEIWDLDNWDKFGEWIDESIIHPVPFSEMTWDSEKLKNIKLDFATDSDVVVALGAADDRAVKVYSLVQQVGKPIMKWLSGKLMDSYVSDTVQLFTNFFVEKMLMDVGFLTKISVIMSDPHLTETERNWQLSDALLSKLKDYVFDLIENVGAITAELVLKKVLKGIEVECLKEHFADAFMELKMVKKYGDIVFGRLGLLEKSTYYDMRLDFRNPGLVVPDVPGYDM